ncbi:MAG: kelch repeat-containing protein, partial [bacterium]
MTKKYIAALLLLMLAAVSFAASPVMSAAKVHYHWAPTDFHATPCTSTDCDEATIWRPGSGPNPQIIGGGTDGTWVQVPAPTTNADRMCSANPYDAENNKVYMIGGDPSGTPNGVPYCQRYDPVLNAWTNLASMPGARTWLDGEGAYCRHQGKIYIAGGYTGSANNQMYIYDIANNSWTTGATMPSATLAYMSGIWNDSLIYIMGGAGPSLTGSNVVQVYNVNRNTWATATSLPEAGDMGSGTIVGDTIYITNAYNRQSGQLWTNARKGAINPSNPLSITWSTWTTVPTLGFNGGTTQCQGWIYRLGGFASLSGGPHKRGWRYNISTGAYETLPWLPSPPTTGVARCNFLSHCDASNELFKIAGDDEGNWATPNNTYYRNQFTPPHDVGVSMIVAPSSPKLEIGVPVTPSVMVKNYGLNTEYNFPVTFRVDSAGEVIYEDALLIVDSIHPGEEITVTFTTDWTPNCELWSGYTVYSFTYLTGDAIPNNDTMRMYTIHTLDTIYSNRSSTAPSIDGYIAPGEWDDAYFVSAPNVFGWEGDPYPWNAARAWFKHDGNYLYAAYAMPLAATRDIGDQIGFYIDENNDGQWASDNSEGNYWYWVNGNGLDEVLYRPITPSGPGTQGVAPGAESKTGTFNGYLVFETKTPFGILPYQLNMNPTADTAHLWFFELDNNRFFGWWPVDMPSDSWLVPAMYGTFILRTLQTGDVGVKSIDAPLHARPGDQVVPKATWKNYGTTSMNFTAYYLMNDPSGTRVYSESQTATLAGGAEVQLTFPSYVVNDEGDWAVKCSTVAGGDVNPANDIKTGSFRVSTAPPVTPGWVEMKSIPGAVKDGGFLAFNPDNGLIYA